MKVANYFGQMLLIGEFDQTFLNELSQNKAITFCDHLAPTKINEKKVKLIKIKKIRKQYPPKNFDFVLINQTKLEKQQKHWLKDSLFISKNKVVIYNYQPLILKRLKRYKLSVEETAECIIINATNFKTNFFREKYFNLLDLKEKTLDYISAFLSI